MIEREPITDFSNLSVSLETSRFCVQTLLPEHVQENYLNWFADPSVRRYISFQPKGNLAELKNFVDQKNMSSDALLLGVFIDSGIHVGNLKYEPIRISSRSAVLGVLVGEPRWRGLGLFTEVFHSCATWFIERTSIETIRVGVDPRNVAAIKSYRRTGFTLDTDMSSRDHIWMQFVL